MRGEGRIDPADRAIHAIAEDQYGVVSRSQLSELGLGRRAIDHRVEVGRLRLVHRGVYAIVGQRLLTMRGHWMAAVLACGPGAVLSHFAAAALWQVRRGQRIEITAPGRRKPREGIRLHFATLPADETTVHDGIPVTTIARTLLDLSAVVQRRELRSAFRQAEQLNLGDPVGIQALTERYPRKPGIPSVRAVFEEAQVGLSVVRSELEERFQDFLLNAVLPSPATNVRIEGMEVDCAWPDQRLIVELDGREFHPAEQRGRDQLRDNEAAATTGATLRYTWADVDRAPCETAGQVYRALRLRGYLGPVRPCSAACRALAASRLNASRLNHQAGVLPR